MNKHDIDFTNVGCGCAIVLLALGLVANELVRIALAIFWGKG